ncbi:unnamed protein product [Haemonchus placei]|uniref:Uncharacterized protein n=1 Tax=Haemonchus placei TaxID=6290 RepID=A0A3P7U1H7_HAEPC|nr:unnamed protein product [Haemonchus placei]
MLSPDIPLTVVPDKDDPVRNALLELLLEVSGATSGMRKALNHMKKSTTPQMTVDDVEKTIGKKERQKIEVIQAMEKTYSTEQNLYSRATSPSLFLPAPSQYPCQIFIIMKPRCH